MEAGPLDRQIVIQRAVHAEDAAGQPIETWGEITTVAANVRTISDGERLQAGGILSSVNMRFQIRWSNLVSDIDTRDRVLYDNRIYDIAGVKELGRRDGLEITAAARSERV